MARIPKGPVLVPPKRAGQSWRVRFTWQGRRYNLTTGLADRGAAREEAARIFAAVVAGTWEAPAPAERPPADASPLLALVAGWLDSLPGVLAPTTIAIYEGYTTAWLKRWRTPGELVAPRALAVWQQARLGEVSRSSVRKERGALAGLLRYLVETGELPGLPVWPGLPSKGAGTRAVTRKRRAQVLPPAQIEAALGLLPETSRGYPVRAFALFLWDTAMRPSMAFRLIAGDHWHPGQGYLAITDTVDKEGDGRSLYLTPRAQAILAAQVPASGRIWLRKRIDGHLKAAAHAAGWPAHEARAFSSYDLRASRATDWAKSPAGLKGASHQLGHKSLATTALYARSSEEDARALVQPPPEPPPKGSGRRSGRRPPKG
jgi:integrase